MWTWGDTVESDSAFSPTLPLFWDGKVSSLKKLLFTSRSLALCLFPSVRRRRANPPLLFLPQMWVNPRM